MAEWDLITERPPNAVYTKNRTAARPPASGRKASLRKEFLWAFFRICSVSTSTGAFATIRPRRARCCWTSAPGNRTRASESRKAETFPEEFSRAKEVLPDLSVPLFVYAYGGETSARAVSRLKDMGYTQVHDIGGLKKCCGSHGYYGPTEGTRWFSSP